MASLPSQCAIAWTPFTGTGGSREPPVPQCVFEQLYPEEARATPSPSNRWDVGLSEARGRAAWLGKSRQL